MHEIGEAHFIAGDTPRHQVDRRLGEQLGGQHRLRLVIDLGGLAALDHPAFMQDRRGAAQGQRSSRQMRLLREQYAPGASSGEEPIVHSEGEECGLVTRGTVELTVDGQISVLNAGDGYYFPTTLPHKFRNIGQDEAEIISANTPANF